MCRQIRWRKSLNLHAKLFVSLLFKSRDRLEQRFPSVAPHIARRAVPRRKASGTANGVLHSQSGLRARLPLAHATMPGFEG